MSVFDFIDRIRGKAAFSAASQTRPVSGQGPFTAAFENYLPRKAEGSFYEVLREAVPYLDLAVNRLTALDGYIEIVGENKALVDEINEWQYNIKVNDMSMGLQEFHRSLQSEAFEQGFAIGEFVVSRDRKDITGLYVADSKLVKFKRGQDGYDIYAIRTGQSGSSEMDQKPMNPANLMPYLNHAENQDPYGTSLFRGLEFTGKVFATIQNANLNVWERFGDPSFHAHLKGARTRNDADLETARKSIATHLETAARDKRGGKSVDIITASSLDSELVIKVLGADGQVLEIEAPLRAVVEQCVAKSGMPPWMFGIQWATTQNMGDGQAEVVKAEASQRQAAKGPIFYNLIRTLLALRGRIWKQGDWGIKWVQVNLHDIEKMAKADFLRAQAAMMLSGASYTVAQNGSGGDDDSSDEGKRSSRPGGKPAHGKTCSCGCAGQKELQRTVPWPALDRIEDGYESRLKGAWTKTAERVADILGLGSLPKAAKGPDDFDAANDMDNDAFTFSAEQRQRIMDEMKGFIGEFEFDADDSPLRYYYGRAYSAGLIQAAYMIGKVRPVLDIIRNSADFEQLARNGFESVKDRATLHIRVRVISEMEAQSLAGTNPRHVASRLSRLFSNANSDWERLARSEMSLAAERAKAAEWKKNNVRGAADAVIAVQDTHPRCRCANTIEHDEEGRAYVVFSPAPDACDICMALAG